MKVEAVDRGREKGFSDAVHVEEAINEGWMRVEKIRPSERFADIARIAGLQTAEVSVVYYAYKNRAVALIDDESARVFARTLGVTVRGSLGVVLSALKEGLMSGEETLKALDKLSDVMYLAPNVYMLAKKGVKRLRGKNLREHGSAGRHRR